MIRSKHAALALLLSTSPLAHALQSITARDGETVFARIAQKEVTRIAVDAARIRKVTGNAGEFVLEKDEERGQIFIRPADPTSTTPINLFVATDRSTVGLLLQPVDAPSDTILIRERANTPPRSATNATTSRHVRALKNLLLALASDAVPDDMSVHASAVELAFRPGLHMIRLRRSIGEHWVGEQYRLTNQTSVEIRLEPRDVYKPGVVAISIEYPDVRPGEATPVFVIRERQPHE